ncbi:premelanosome protein a [Osmerus eperlanus]|uniref:premelanosome protein a n=1 Tax=Osmerus eperlanus TaxID=29151 RepID=UPI002E0D7EA8
MRTLVMVLVLALSSADAAKPKTRFTRYRSWNSRLYPVWKDGDSRYRDCWAGGEVTFDVKNDAPTLTGAKATFNIDLRFPQNQTVLPDGQVVWARNCSINGTQYNEGQAVYPDQEQEWNGVFPDGTPFTQVSDRKPHYVFVWKTWGRYWQVADGPSSSISIGTDNIPLGSYNMEVVIYHCRGKDKFIPLGYASTTFSITDQIPFTVSLNQVNDINQADQSFIQNRAIAFSINLHDPSQYLITSDITFNWDFGDNSGTLISRERSVTHTYLTAGTFRPQVVLMASIPNGCADPTAAVISMESSAVPAVVVMDSTPAPAPPAPASTQETGDIALDVPASETAPADDLSLAASVQPAGDTDTAAVVDTDAASVGVEVASVAPAVDDATVAVPVPAAEDAAIVPATVDPAAAPVAEVGVAAEDIVAAAVAVATVVPAVEGATAVPVAAVAEETAGAVVDTEAAAADETAVVMAATAAAEVPVIDATVSVAPVAEVVEATVDLAATVFPEVPAVAPVAPEEAAGGEAEVEATAAAEVTAEETVDAADNVLVPAATEDAAVEEAVAAVPAADAEAEIVETVNEAAATTVSAALNEITAPADGEVLAEVEAGTEAAQVALVLAKRQAPELEANAGCMVYRYGSFSTALDVIEGIESAEIIQVANVVSLTTEVEQNAVDLTITCQGSLPNEVCTVISEADCATPVQTVCSAVTPSPECQMILRQFFNNSGVFCINVSLTNDVSLAMASARVSVTVGSNSSTAGTVAAVLGVMVLVCAIGTIALTYKRFKQYRPLTENSGNGGGSSTITSVPLLLWNLLSRQSPGESRPLLQGRVV